jgi:hypothetical protein
MGLTVRQSNDHPSVSYGVDSIDNASEKVDTFDTFKTKLRLTVDALGWGSCSILVAGVID